VFKRYVAVLQELYTLDVVKSFVIRRAEVDPAMKYIKGHLKSTPGY
jgi:hypothetical protein